ERIGDQRMADMRHMHTDLMGAAGLEFAGEPGDVPAVLAKPGLCGIVSNGLAPVAAYGLLEAISGVPPQRRVDSTARLLHPAPGEGDVAAVQRSRAAMIGELGGEPGVRDLRLRGNHDAGRVLVE